VKDPIQTLVLSEEEIYPRSSWCTLFSQKEAKRDIINGLAERTPYIDLPALSEEKGDN
jgi:hypothetical protein